MKRELVEKQLSQIEKLGLEFLQENGSAETDVLEKHIAKELGTEQRAAYWRVKHLFNQGLIEEKERKGAARIWGLAEKGETALSTGVYDFVKIDLKTATTLRGKQPDGTTAEAKKPEAGQTPETAVKVEPPAPAAVPAVPAAPKKIEVKTIEVAGFNDVKVLPVSYELNLEPGEYIANTGNEIQILQAHAKNGIPLLFSGAPGVAKTYLVDHYCAKENIPKVHVQCSENTDKGDLISQFVIHNGETPLVIGAMARAILVANHYGKANLHFDEINTLTPQGQKMLLSVLDHRKEVTIPQINRTFKLEAGKELLITATMNKGNRGTYELNKEFVNRFSMKNIPFPRKDVEMKILKQFTQISDDMKEKVIALAKLTRENTRISYQISPRELIMFGRNLIEYQKVMKDYEAALKEALLNTFVSKYDQKNDRDFIVSSIESTLHVTLPK